MISRWTCMTPEKDEVFSLLNITTVEGQRVEIPAVAAAQDAPMRSSSASSKRARNCFRPPDAREHAAATMLAPIRKGERVIGVLFIQNHGPAPIRKTIW